ncbi:hypothetical protein [Paenibacillus sp. BJ-4]|uniref:hypothetical protein n=1 Tax=Paenibacillus sp. BJ-4 TaxID=2878097 RepID=UPI001CEFC579|nr:hypothetical protein [Paenibacillus sp. BJ-4]
MKHIELLSKDIERHRDKIIRISEQIWQFAETRFEEYQSAELLCRSLEEEGFAIERGVGGIETAYARSHRKSSPVLIRCEPSSKTMMVRGVLHLHGQGFNH